MRAPLGSVTAETGEVATNAIGVTSVEKATGALYDGLVDTDYKVQLGADNKITVTGTLMYQSANPSFPARNNTGYYVPLKFNGNGTYYVEITEAVYNAEHETNPNLIEYPAESGKYARKVTVDDGFLNVQTKVKANSDSEGEGFKLEEGFKVYYDKDGDATVYAPVTYTVDASALKFLVNRISNGPVSVSGTPTQEETYTTPAVTTPITASQCAIGGRSVDNKNDPPAIGAEGEFGLTGSATDGARSAAVFTVNAGLAANKIAKATLTFNSKCIEKNSDLCLFRITDSGFTQGGDLTSISIQSLNGKTIKYIANMGNATDAGATITYDLTSDLRAANGQATYIIFTKTNRQQTITNMKVAVDEADHELKNTVKATVKKVVDGAEPEEVIETKTEENLWEGDKFVATYEKAFDKGDSVPDKYHYVYTGAAGDDTINSLSATDDENVITLKYSKTPYKTAKFVVKVGDDAKEGIPVVVSGGALTAAQTLTSAETTGEATIDLLPGNYSWSVAKDYQKGYGGASGTFEIKATEDPADIAVNLEEHTPIFTSIKMDTSKLNGPTIIIGEAREIGTVSTVQLDTDGETPMLETKPVTYSVAVSDGGTADKVTVDGTGKVSIEADATAGTYKITASSTQGGADGSTTVTSNEAVLTLAATGEEKVAAASDDFSGSTSLFTALNSSGAAVGFGKNYPGNPVFKFGDAGKSNTAPTDVANAVFETPLAPLADDQTVEISYDHYAGYIDNVKSGANREKVIIKALNATDEELFSYTYECFSTNVSSVKLFGTEKVTEAFAGGMGKGQNGWDSFSATPTKVTVTLTGGATPKLTVKFAGTANKTFEESAPVSITGDKKISKIVVMGNVGNSDRSGGIDNFLTKYVKAAPAE